MTTLKQLQQNMMAYLLKGEPADELIAEQAGVDKQQRLSIYFNAYRARLAEALDIDHPVLGVYLGDDLFDRMLSSYIQTCPSYNKSLRQFGDQLPSFLNQDDYFSQMPFLAELARFERLLLTAFDAEDKLPAGVEFLQQLSPEQWPQAKLQLHPSAQLFSSQWNVVHIWQELKAEQMPPEPLEGENHWLLWRNHERLTEFMSLDEIGYLLIKQLILGSDFAQICEILLLELEPDQAVVSLVEYLEDWLQRGILCPPGEANLQLL